MLENVKCQLKSCIVFSFNCLIGNLDEIEYKHGSKTRKS